MCKKSKKVSLVNWIFCQVIEIHVDGAWYGTALRVSVKKKLADGDAY